MALAEPYTLLVPEIGLEPIRLAALDFESNVSTIPPLGQLRVSLNGSLLGLASGNCTYILKKFELRIRPRRESV